MSEADKAPYYFVSTVGRAVAVLDQFINSESELGITEITRRLDMHKSVVHRLVSTMVDLNLLAPGVVAGTYRLGVKSLELGLSYLRNSPLERVAQYNLTKLAQQFPDMAFHVAILDGAQMVYQKSVSGPDVKWASSTLGRRREAYSTSLGKVMLAYLSPSSLEGYLSSVELIPFTSKTITSPEDLRKELLLVRSQGWAFDNQENIENHVCVGAPIRDHTGQVIAAISIAGLNEHFERYQRDVLVEAAKAAASDISYELGFSPSRPMATPKPS
ncbi:MAG: IclR family transcriptional regulator [Anaerolineaceae bacterium]|nr:MAG: IclR family transcriptional regulator [Anaerolineaceae bacterium]